MRRNLLGVLVAPGILLGLLAGPAVARPPDVLSPEAYGVIEGAWGANALEDYGLVVFVHAMQVDAALDYMTALEAARQAEARRRIPVRSSSSTSSGGACGSGGGNYQANPNGQYVHRESGGNYCARNPSGACGAYQIMPGTWQNFEGYASACDAPPAVQDRKAATMAPCNWQPPNYCA